MDDDLDIPSLRVVDLKLELEKRGLSKSGTKKELAERLQVHINSLKTAAQESLNAQVESEDVDQSNAEDQQKQEDAQKRLEEQRDREEAERKQKEEKVLSEKKEKARLEKEQELEAKREQERKEKEEQERKAKREEERKVKEEMERKGKDRKAKEELERKTKQEEERKVKEEMERKEKDRKAKEELERKTKQEEERKVKEEQERKEKDRKAKEELERTAKEEKERKANERKKREEKELQLEKARRALEKSSRVQEEVEPISKEFDDEIIVNTSEITFDDDLSHGGEKSPKIASRRESIKIEKESPKKAERESPKKVEKESPKKSDHKISPYKLEKSSNDKVSNPDNVDPTEENQSDNDKILGQLFPQTSVEDEPSNIPFRKLSRSQSKASTHKKGTWSSRVKDQQSTNVLVSSQELADIVPDIKPIIESLSDEKVLNTEEDHNSDPESMDAKMEVIEEDCEDEEPEKEQEVEKKQSNGTHRVVSPVEEIVETKLSLEELEKLPKPLVDIATKKRHVSENKGGQSCYLSIRNLVRPFTLDLFKACLRRTGTISEEEFWMDRIKSQAIVKYSTLDEAEETLQALDGVTWPNTNPKTLIVQYTTEKVLQEAMARGDASFGNSVSTRRETKQQPQPFKRIRDEKELADENKEKRVKKESVSIEEPKKKSLEELFRKTKTQPSIFWLPKC